MKLVSRHLVAPPSSTVPATRIPLSFLDIFWLGAKPVQRTFLYKLPSISISLFLQNVLPNLENSLSLTLKHFFPVCGSLVFEPDSRPYIQYEQGYSVVLSVVESDESVYEQLANRDHAKPIDDAIFGELVPSLSKDEFTTTNPLFAIQATVFPNSGVCIGIAYKHVLGDGRSIMHFLRTWASICRNSGVVPNDCVLPLVDRSLVPDPEGVLVDTFLKQLLSIPAELLGKHEPQKASEAKSRATFYIKKNEIQNMRERILSQVEDGETLHLSSFVLTCSLMWVCLIQSLRATETSNEDHFIFGFVIDCCDRYEYKSIVPSTYFGNCLCMGCFAMLDIKELEDENGIKIAAKAIGKTIQKLVAKGPTKDPDKWLSNFLETTKSVSIHSIIGVAGSPRLGAYGLDFGWGKPEKVEVVSIDDPKSISLAESRDEEGGVEAGLVLEKPQMEAFIAIFEECKAKYCVPVSMDSTS